MSNLLTAESPIIILPSLATEFGIPEAALLQQIHYTAMQKEKGLTHQGHKWIYNTLDQWHAKFSCWSMATIERAITKLRKLGIIHIQRLGHHKSIRTNYYRIDYPKLAHIPQLASPAPCGKDTRKMQPSAPQNEDMNSLKMQERIPAKCGNGITKNTQENSKNSFKTQTAVFENSEQHNGTAQATVPEPTAEQLATLKPNIRNLWRQLRQAKVDIAYNDPNLAHWINHGQAKTISQLAIDHLAQHNTWHTPAQLQRPSNHWSNAA
jgi:hypothetical protein